MNAVEIIKAKAMALDITRVSNDDLLESFKEVRKIEGPQAKVISSALYSELWFRGLEKEVEG